MQALNFGSNGDEVKLLQQYLVGLGYKDVKTDGIYGPVTQQAVKQFQLDNGLKADGVFGPQTAAKANTVASTSTKAGTPGTGLAADDPSKMYNTDTGALNPNFIPKTQADLDKMYNTAAASHPAFSGNSQDAITNAANTGDFSGLLNQDGKPFSQAQQDAATTEAGNALAPEFNAAKQNDTTSTQSDLNTKNTDYNNFLNTEKTNFQTDKTTLDKNAADNGVLFSGGRNQKENNLKTTYQTADAAKAASTGADISNTANAYQYKYGNNAAQNPTLSQYYQLGGNNYNPKVATNGVTPGGLSSIYNAGNYNYGGTAVAANSANTAVRAAGLLGNAGNKLLTTGYQNQF